MTEVAKSRLKPGRGRSGLLFSVCLAFGLCLSALLGGLSLFPASAAAADGWIPVGAGGIAGAAAPSAVALAPDQTPYMIYADTSAQNKATVKKYDNVNGWVTVGPVGFSDSSISSPSIKIHADGTIYVLYSESQKLTVKKYSETTNTWDIIGKSQFDTGATNQQLELGADGTPYVAYRKSSKPFVRKFVGISDTVSDGWSYIGPTNQEPIVTSGTISELSFAVASDNTMYVAYKDTNINGGAGVVLKHSGEDSAVWTALGDNGTASPKAIMKTSVALAPDGTPYLAYVQNYTDFSTFVQYANVSVIRYTGATWEAVGSPMFSLEGEWGSFTLPTYFHLSLKISNENVPYLVAQDLSANPNDKGKAVVKFYNGSSWETLGGEYLSTGTAPSDFGLALSNTSIPYVSFLEGTTAKVLKYSDAAVKSWQDIVPAGDMIGRYSNFTMAPDDTLHMVYIESNKNLTVKKKIVLNNEEAWINVGESFPYTVDGSSITTPMFPVIRVSPSGTPYIVFQASDADNSLSRLVIMKFTGKTESNLTGWESVGPNPFYGPVPLLQIYTSSYDLDFDSRDIPYVFFSANGASTNGLDIRRGIIKKFDINPATGNYEWIQVGNSNIAIPEDSIDQIDHIIEPDIKIANDEFYVSYKRIGGSAYTLPASAKASVMRLDKDRNEWVYIGGIPYVNRSFFDSTSNRQLSSEANKPTLEITPEGTLYLSLVDRLFDSGNQVAGFGISVYVWNSDDDKWDHVGKPRFVDASDEMTFGSYLTARPMVKKSKDGSLYLVYREGKTYDGVINEAGIYVGANSDWSAKAATAKKLYILKYDEAAKEWKSLGDKAITSKESYYFSLELSEGGSLYLGYNETNSATKVGNIHVLKLPVTALALTAVSEDAQGKVNNGKTKITVTGTTYKNTLVYRNYGIEREATPDADDVLQGYTTLSADGYVEARNGDHVAVAEINPVTQGVVRFGWVDAVVEKELVPASGLTVTAVDVAGAAQDGHTRISVTGATYADLAYRNYRAATAVVPYEETAVEDYILLPTDRIIPAANGDTIAVVELYQGKVLRFGTVIAVVEKEPVSSGGLTVTAADVTGYENNGKTQITVTGVTYANQLVYRNYGTSTVHVPDEGSVVEGYSPLPADRIISAANGDAIAVVELDDGKVVRFGSGIAVIVNEQPPIGGGGGGGGVVVVTAPELLLAGTGDAQVGLSWNPVSGAAGYTIYRSVSAAVYGDVAGTVSSAVYSYQVTGLTNGTTYYFTVTAFSSNEEGPHSNSVSGAPFTVPGAPRNVSAEAGNTKVTVSFVAPESDGGSPITKYVVLDSSGKSVAEGTGSPIVVEGLTNGAAYSFTVKAVNAAGFGATSAASNTVTPYVQSGGGGGFIGSANESTIDLGKSTTVVENGQTVNTIVLDSKLVEAKLAASTEARPVIAVSASEGADVVKMNFEGKLLKSLESKEAVLELSTGNASYLMPAAQINLESISNQLGTSVDNITIEVKIAAATGDLKQQVQNAAEKEGLAIVAAPVEFTITASYGDKVVEIKAFETFIKRTIAVPDGVGASGSLTAVVVEADGSVRHIPTSITTSGGKTTATISSMTNSVYAIISHTAKFSDLTGHWAEATVLDMGARLIVNGAEEGLYKPDQSITRAEFAAILVRALGLKLESDQAVFSDVPATDWYNQAVQSAYRYGLISGFEDGTFRPMNTITREEAMSMIANAMKLTALKSSATQAEEVLNGFADASELSDWAKTAVLDCLGTGIAGGRSDTGLAPQSGVTRAEVAVMVQRLLKKSGLI